MFKASNYMLVESLEQAYELNQAKNATIVGGMMWLKMSRRSFKTIIDLSGLQLNQIIEDEDAFSIGCMTTLRQLELHEGLNQIFDDCFKKAVEHIVGVQFRNTATIGGSVYGRYGFSDVLTMLMCLDSYVELYKGGIVSMAEFATMPYDSDIIVRVIVKKNGARVSYLTQRLSETDFPILACSVAHSDVGWKIAIGARPKKAIVIKPEMPEGIEGMNNREEVIANIAENIAQTIAFESNMRGSSEYRQLLCKVLVSRGIQEIIEREGK